MNFEEQLRQAAAEANDALVGSFEESSSYEHSFSPKFEKEIKRLKRKANHSNVRYSFKKIAAVLLIILLGSLSVVAINTEARTKLWGWTITQYEKYVSYMFKPQVTEGESVDADYYISELPSGYAYKESLDITNAKMIIYEEQGGSIMSLLYSVSDEKFLTYISLDDVKREKISFKGTEAELYIALHPEDTSALVWIDPNTSTYFCLAGCFSTEQLIDIAGSVMVK